MAIRNVINYPNGGKLLVFFGGNVKYIPTKKYEEARKKAMSTPALSLRKKTASPFKNASTLIDKVFEVKVPGHTSLTGKSALVQAVNNLRTTRVIPLSRKNNQESPLSIVGKPSATPNLLKVATS